MKLEELLSKADPNDLAKRIDHTNLKPDASVSDLERTCREALEYEFRGCCIAPWFVREAASILAGSDVKLVTVAGFPLGNIPLSVKKAEVEAALVSGADEVDVVMNVSAFKSGRVDYVRNELSELVELVRGYGGVIKVIIETSFLSSEEIISAARLVAEVGADFVKTNTGFGKRGVLPGDIVLIKKALSGGKTRVKAAGGIRRAIDALILIELGADVLGTSSGKQIVDELKLLSKYS